MKMMTIPLALSLAGSLALAAPPAKKVEPNARGVTRSTSVRNEHATANANGPRLVRHTTRTNVQRRGVRVSRGRSARAAVRAHASARPMNPNKY